MLSAISKGVTRISNFSFNYDCARTKEILSRLGVKIRLKGRAIVVYGKGLWGLSRPRGTLYAGESGTTARLMLGLLAAQRFDSLLDGSSFLRKRPMERVVVPLEMMGARFSNRKRLPIKVFGSPLSGIRYRMPVASAQVKSAILLAGLYADKGTTVIEGVNKSRDHTERILRLFKGRAKALKSPGNLAIPGDISSAAFFIAAAAILKGSRIVIKNVSINPTRMGFIRALKRMGARIDIKPAASGKKWEPAGNIEVRPARRLKSTIVRKREIPFLIDELPILMVCACFAEGATVIHGVGELRVKETDRIRSMIYNLGKMGASVKSAGDTLIIKGGAPLRAAAGLKSFADHRTAMSMVIAGICAAGGASTIDDIKCVNKSFPGFLPVLKSLLTYN